MKSFSPFFDDSPLRSASPSSRTYDSLNQLSPVVQTHLKQVYVSLCCSVVASAVGAYLHMVWNIGGFLTIFGTIGGLVWLLTIRPSEVPKRFSLLMTISLLRGASIGPIIKSDVDFDPSALVSAFMVTAIAFACLSRAAMRKEFLYLGGLLSSGVLSIISWLHIIILIFCDCGPLVELYFGVLVYVGYMVIDTQDIIEKAHHGDLDYVKHAFILLNDVITVYAPNVAILKDFGWNGMR